MTGAGDENRKNALNPLEGLAVLDCVSIDFYSPGAGRRCPDVNYLYTVGNGAHQIPASRGESAGNVPCFPSEQSQHCPGFLRLWLTPRLWHFILSISAPPRWLVAPLQLKDFAFCCASVLCLASDSKCNSYNVFYIIFCGTIISGRSYY